MLWKSRCLRAALSIAAMMAVGCGSDPPAVPPADSGARDVPTPPGDTAPGLDTPSVDNGPSQDSTAPEDGSPADTSPADTATVDTEPVDTGPPPDAGCIRDDQCLAGRVCMAGACVEGCNPMQACAMGQACCSGVCVNTQTSMMHCGACGSVCSAPSGTAMCVMGRCTLSGCMGTNADCDMMASTGCETDTATTLSHCGMCGRACPMRANATSGCAMGICGFTCSAGFGDCDGMADNGCETDVRSTVSHCGMCRNACMFANAMASCATGTCGFTCSAGFGNCDSMAPNGCETNTQTSVMHCGMCGSACTTANATPACAMGACAVGRCNDGFGNCDMMAATGCEVNLRTDRANCGMCGRACGAGQVCAAGACQFGNGSSGALNVTATQTINGIRAGASGVAGATMVTLTSVVGGSFAAGQEVLLHQTQAATGNVGQYEYGRVVSATATALVLASPLVNSYLSNTTNRAQVVVVPEFTSVTVSDSGTLTAAPWDGTSGGILVFDAGAAVTVNGTLQMNGRGFRGTRRVCGTNPTYRCQNGFSGEGERGPGRASITANGSGGGGGGQGQDCGSGGGGGYGVAGEIGTAGTNGVCRAGEVHPPGDPGAASGLPSLVSSVLFGGAGGEGGADEDGYAPGGGGNGGGLVMFRATTVAITGAVSSNGDLGQDGNQGGCPGSVGGGSGMGGGGGGAGGAVRIISITSAAVGASRIAVTRGDGGQCAGVAPGNFPGGIGGNGRIGILSPMTTGTTLPMFTRE